MTETLFAPPELFDREGHIRRLRNIEADVIRYALKRYGTPSEAARRLGIGRSTLYRQMRIHGLRERADA